MFYHAREPQILMSVAHDHPLFGKDLRNVRDGLIAEAAARAILPAFERMWSFVALAHGEHVEISHLSSSAYRRVIRVLIQRIKIAKLSQCGEPCTETQDDLLDSVTLSFIHMAGVFDVLAIINGLLAGETMYENTGWQKASFRKRLRDKVPEAIALMEPTAKGGRFLRAVLDLRNTIHRRMPDPSMIGRAEGDPTFRRTALLLERSSHDAVLKAFEKLDWVKHQGIQLYQDFLWINPETVVNLLVKDGVPIINTLMDLTPVRNLNSQPFPLNPDKTLFPSQFREYAVRYLRLSHLVDK